MSETTVDLDINISGCNAAFQDGNAGPELARILHQLADELESEGEGSYEDRIRIHDINGNKVGICTVSIEVESDEDDEDADDE